MGEMRSRTRLEVPALKHVPRPGRLMQVQRVQGNLKTPNYRHGMVLLSLLIVRIGMAWGMTGTLDGLWSELLRSFADGGFSMRHRERKKAKTESERLFGQRQEKTASVSDLRHDQVSNGTTSG